MQGMQGQEAALHQAYQAFRAWREEEGREVLSGQSLRFEILILVIDYHCYFSSD